MTDNKWNVFPHTSSEYNYEGSALQANWEQLHLGNKEPYPSEERVKQLFATHPALKSPSSDTAKIAEDLQQAWRHYHRGEYQQAYEMGVSLGVIGYLVASRSQAMYAYYLEDNESRKRNFSKEAAERAEEMLTIMPDYANAYFMHAYALGRYSQSISVVKALAQGLGGKIKHASEKAVKLQKLTLR